MAFLNWLTRIAESILSYAKRIVSLLQEIWNSKSQRLAIFGLFSLLIILTGIALSIAPVLSIAGIISYDFRLGGVALTIGGMIGLIVWIFLDNLSDRTSIIIRSNYEAAAKRAEEKPSASKPAWDMASAILQTYFNRNLTQIKWIFWLSVFVMLVGFALVVFGITLTLQNPQNVTVAIVGGVAGVITEFVGATFLFIYRSAIEQASKYAKTLERMNSVGMAMQILDGISSADAGESKEKLIDAKIEVAKLLLMKNEETEIK